MLPEIKRLFVNNIPQGVSENDLQMEFTSYGQVKRIELKRKENLVDPENPNIFAFVIIEIDKKSLDLCIEEFSKQKLRGRYVNVSVAKESFLDRLKREREEASNNCKINSIADKGKDVFAERKELPKLKSNVPSTVQSESSSDSDDTSESESSPTTAATLKKDESVNNLKKSVPTPQKIPDEDSISIEKKNASSSVFNGKIKIQSAHKDPIHIISSKNQKTLKRLNEKAEKADQKRKESLNKMNSAYNQQKLAIQRALAEVDSNKSKKIMFNDDDESNLNGSSKETPKTNVKRKNLFNDNDEDAEDDNTNYQKAFEIKEKFQGKKGEKLMKIQSKFKLDPRFHVDERFLENDDDDDDDNDYNNQSKSNERANETDHYDNERSWQLGIIEKIVGRKFETLPEPHKKKLRKTMFRFDPSKEEHQKFFRNVEIIAQTFKESKSDEKHNGKGEIEVSKEQFYKVDDDLKTSLNRRGDGFSLLSLFGASPDDDKMKNKFENKNECVEKIISADKNLDAINIVNPFKYDSSDSEDNETAPIVNKVQSSANAAESSGGRVNKAGLWTENFFIFNKDARLKDGISFFSRSKLYRNEEPEHGYEIRSKLKYIINKKISKTKKNVLGFKNKNKFKRKSTRQ